VGGSYTLSGRAGLEGLAELHQLVEQVGRDHPELPSSDLAMMETAIIEVVGNVVEHGTPPGTIAYDFHLEVTTEHLRASLVETGDPVPMRAKSGDQDHELAESGRGLPLARAALSELRYERRGGLNAWTLTRLLRRQDHGSPQSP
jgi:serine/threonine-protein kinase RsbW